MSTFKTQAIILRRENYREHDRIFTIYSREYGKISCVAVGIRKIQSKQAGHMEPFTYVDMMLAKGRGPLPRFTTAVTLNAFRNTRQDILRIMCANNFIDMVEKAVTDEELDFHVFDLLVSALELIDRQSDFSFEQSFFVARMFGFQLLSYLGYKPELLRCLVCKNMISDQEVVFHSMQGGLVERKCLQNLNIQYAFPINKQIIDVLRLALSQSLADIPNLAVDRQSLFALCQIVQSFIETHLERPLKSSLWFERVSQKYLQTTR